MYVCKWVETKAVQVVSRALAAQARLDIATGEGLDVAMADMGVSMWEGCAGAVPGIERDANMGSTR